MRLSTIMSYINIPQYIWEKKNVHVYIIFVNYFNIYTLIM